MAIAKEELRRTGTRALLQALKSPSPLTLRVCLPTVIFSCMLRGEQGSRRGAESVEWLLILYECVCVCVCVCVGREGEEEEHKRPPIHVLSKVE